MTTVRSMVQLKLIFADNFVTFRWIKFKLTSIIWRFQTNSEGKFHTNPKTGNEFPHTPYCTNPSLSTTSFLQWGLWENPSSFVEFNWNPASELVKNRSMIEISSRLIERDVTKLLPKFCCHLYMERTLNQVSVYITVLGILCAHG